MAEILVRPANKQDLVSIEHHYGQLDNVGDPFCDPARTRDVRPDRLLVAEFQGKYAGFLCWHVGERPFFAPQVERFAHIREVQVLEDFQGKGIGRKLIVEALERLKALGVQEVFLATADKNDVARHLYESLGFNQFRKQIQYRLKIG